MKLIYFLACLLISSTCFANSTIDVTPKSCVIQQGWCETQLTIKWRVNTVEAVCIEAVEIDYSYCVNNNQTLSTSLNIKTNSDVTFILKNAKTKQALAKSTLKVFVSEYKQRRRQRHAWSVI
jgi:hypothetical protein